MLDCYIINLDHARDRWSTTFERFSTLRLNVIRVSAIEGKDLIFPHPDFAAWRYFFWCGHRVAPNEVACYFSHIKAMKAFLETNKEYAMICEDDVVPLPGLMDVIKDAMQYSHAWDCLRLNGIKPTKGVPFAALPHEFQLCCDLKTSSGAGANIMSRYAAKTVIERLLPMRLPYDVALFYDWPIGIREAVVQPFPIRLDETMHDDSTIGKRMRYPLLHPASIRHLTSLPYRIFSRTSRKLSRIYWAMQNHIWPPKPIPLEECVVLEFSDEYSDSEDEPNHQQREVA